MAEEAISPVYAVSEPIREIDVLWINAGLSCDGDTIAMTAATQPSIEDLILGNLPAMAQPLHSYICRGVCMPTDPAKYLVRGPSGSFPRTCRGGFAGRIPPLTRGGSVGVVRGIPSRRRCPLSLF
jgi:hypothetical protein